MDNIRLENKLAQLDDIMTHVGYVVQAGHKLCRKLIINNEEDIALQLMKRILIHDVSKASPDEFYGMAAFSNDQKSMKDLRVTQTTDGKMKAIKLHWLRNDHHPEFWSSFVPNTLTHSEPLKISEAMDDIAVAEMCCDWYSRSMQFKSNVMEFYALSKSRWTFTEHQRELIEKYLTMLQDDSM